MTKIILRIPEGTEWPVIGRDPDTGSLILRLGFVTAAAEASGCTLYHDGTNRPLFTEDMIATLLLEWYRERRQMGAPACPTMEAVIQEARKESLH
jgi:2-C-methyl-D-erythritol 4-phosphate cytidylyltransferase